MDVVKTADWVIDPVRKAGNKGCASGRRAPEKGWRLTSGLHGLLPQELSCHRPLGLRASCLPGFLQHPTVRPSSCEGQKHNLKDLTCPFQGRRLVVVTGFQDPGNPRSSLTFSLPKASAGYLESLAPYERQYVRVLERPDVDSVTGSRRPSPFNSASAMPAADRPWPL